jgi:hypothetical protein
VDRPTADELGRWLTGPLGAALCDRYGGFELSLLSQADTVADGTTVLLLRDSAGQSRAVVLCSAPASPGMVECAMGRARKAKEILGASIGTPILDPLLEGGVMGLSYAVLPYCRSLSKSRPVWWIQRALLRPPIFDWLWRANERTVRDVNPAAIDQSFAEPLRRIQLMKSVLSDRLLAAAEMAGERLHAEKWTPKHVLMHGDFWTGNILIRSVDDAAEQKNWRHRFAIIDWAGSEVRGHAMFDLIRMAQSIRLSPRRLRSEVARHCHLLRCEPVDAMSYLLAALGHILMNLEHFPIDLYARMAESCFMTLARTRE